MNPNDIFVLFAALVGFPAFVAAVVNVAKYFGWIKDGSAPTVVFYANVLGLLGVAVAFYTGNLPLLSQIDAALGNFATFLLTLLAFLIDLGLPKLFHAGFRGMPVIGFHYPNG